MLRFAAFLKPKVEGSPVSLKRKKAATELGCGGAGLLTAAAGSRRIQSAPDPVQCGGGHAAGTCGWDKGEQKQGGSSRECEGTQRENPGAKGSGEAGRDLTGVQPRARRATAGSAGHCRCWWRRCPPSFVEGERLFCSLPCSCE